MPPKSNSSASSATRKKQARKAASAATKDLTLIHEPQADPTQAEPSGKTLKVQKKDKKDKKAPKLKQFIPPPTYSGDPDPVDVFKLGLYGSLVRPERVVMLRKLAKKDPVTIERGLEDWMAWSLDLFNPQTLDASHNLTPQLELIETIPVLIHHFPSLALHPSRRVRVLTITLHHHLLTQQLSDSHSPADLLRPPHLEQPDYLGSWLICKSDADKAVRQVAERSWNATFHTSSKDDASKPDLSSYVLDIIQYLLPLIMASNTLDPQSQTIDSSQPRKHALLDESRQSTTNRLRASAIDALVYLLKTQEDPHDWIPLLQSSIMAQPLLWNMLFASNEPDPLVRRAIWNIVQILSTLDPLQPLLHSAMPFMTYPVIHAGMQETNNSVQGAMIIGLISFISGRSELWLKLDNLSSTSTPIGLPSQDSSSTIPQQTSDSTHPVLHTFFSFLQSACSANPVLLYPALVVILASLPPSMLTPNSSPSLDDFFHHFWSAYSGRLLRSTGVIGLTTFHHASADCLIFFDKRLSPGREACLELHFRRMWDQALSGTFQFGDELDVLMVAMLHVAQRSPSADLYVWPAILETVDQGMETSKLLRCLTFLNTSCASSQDHRTTQQLCQARMRLFSRALIHLLSDPGDGVAEVWAPLVTACVPDEAKLLEAVDDSTRGTFFDFIREVLPFKFWAMSPPHRDLFFACIRCHTCGLGVQTWQAVVKAYSSRLDVSHIPTLLEIAERIESHISLLQLPPAELDDFVLDCTAQILKGESRSAPLLRSLILRPAPWIMKETVAELLHRLADKLYFETTTRLHQSSSLDFSSSDLLLRTCAPYFTEPRHPELTTEHLSLSTTHQFIIAAYIMHHFWPLLYGPAACGLASLAETVHVVAWRSLQPSDADQSIISLLRLFKDFIVNPDCCIHPLKLVDAARQLTQTRPEIRPSHLLDILLSGSKGSSELTRMVPFRIIPPILMTRDSLVSHNSDCAADQHPLTISLKVPYDRLVLVILDLLAQDRQVSQGKCWLWEHCMYLGQWAHHLLQLRAVEPAGKDGLTWEELEGIKVLVDTNVTYAISSLAPQLNREWHLTATSLLKDASRSTEASNDQLIILLRNLALASRRETTETIAAQNLRKILDLIFKHANMHPNDLETWLSLARSVETSDLTLSLSVTYAIKPYLLSNPLFQQYQNLTAGKLTDVPVAKVSSSGVCLIKVLCATAPPVESPLVFLPPRRCIFLLQSLAGWMRDADDIDFELNARMLELCLHLAPIVQTVQGSHWNFILDMVGINLEEGTWADEDSLVPVWHACHLIRMLQSLASRNDTLDKAIQLSMKGTFKLVYQLFVSRPVGQLTSKLTDSIMGALEEILNDPVTQVDTTQQSVEELVNLVVGPSASTCILAYSLACKCVKVRVDSLSIEAELESDTITTYAIPDKLLQLLDEDPNDEPSRTLLGWLLLFAYFENASLRLKNAYNAQLREAVLVPRRLLPLLHDILHISDRGKSRDVSIWDIPNFDVMLIEDYISQPVALAAFVYYRALQTIPSHIRNWWDECRNKQLSLSVANFSTRHFSPILIGHELSRVKDQTLSMALEDEQTSVKVNTMANEVKVVYVVDEESMEILVKIPVQYPLQPVEVLDIRKVGVPEAMWRAWLLSIQHTIATQNGSIAEGLALFKKNVSLHFEGVEACAICYSIISVVDRSLPTKACRTCHNRFHPSCIFKWFSTSHGSSCPLCRSLF